MVSKCSATTAKTLGQRCIHALVNGSRFVHEFGCVSSINQLVLVALFVQSQ